MRDLKKPVRTFLALPVCVCLAESIDAYRTQIPSTRDRRWIPRQNWHLTVRFFGDLSERQSKRIQNAIDTVSMPDPFVLTGGELAGFPNGRPSVLAWLPDDCETLLQWVVRMDARIDEAVEHSRDRSFKPHVSLARGPRRGLLEEGRTDLPGVLHVRSLVLFGSDLSGNGSRYFPIKTWVLSNDMD